MITKAILMSHLITPLEEKHGALATTIPEHRMEYIRHYYALLKYHPKSKVIMAWMVASEQLVPPRDLADIISNEKHGEVNVYDSQEAKQYD